MIPNSEDEKDQLEAIEADLVPVLQGLMDKYESVPPEKGMGLHSAADAVLEAIHQARDARLYLDEQDKM